MNLRSGRQGQRYDPQGVDIDVNEMDIEDAKELGAMALFGEKYGQRVRVVKMGDFSLEFLRGNYLDNTTKAGAF
jgi:alanyl-tRNA synthetase